MKKIKWLKYLLPIGAISLTTPLFLTSCNSDVVDGVSLTNYDDFENKMNILRQSFRESPLYNNQYVLAPILIENFRDDFTKINAYKLNSQVVGNGSLAEKKVNMGIYGWVSFSKEDFVNTFKNYSEKGYNKITYALFYEEVTKDEQNNTTNKSVKEYGDGTKRIVYEYKM